MFAADDAETRGDAAGALALMGTRPLGPDGKPFWRPWRVRRLTQLVALGPLLPRWATSRWVLEQALQHLDPSRRAQTLRALTVAIDLRGGPDALPGVDQEDARAKVVDHDWVFRQVFLYELGGLEFFLRRVASPDLLAGADQIDDWARAPMGGYRLLDHDPDVVTWEDLADGRHLVMPNIGSALLVVPGECVLGRRVPIEDGSMFETAPLVVPRWLAEQVARRPADWLVALSSADPSDGDEPIRTGGHHVGLVNDVPPMIWQYVVLGPGRDLLPTAEDVATAALDLARRALVGVDPEWEHPDAVDVWPCLGAALLEPEVLAALTVVMTDRDAPTLVALADLLAEPAASLCRELVRGLSNAA